MKYLSILTLVVFINFTALPSLAVMFDWEIPTLSTDISEEEVCNNLVNFNEKLPPRPYDLEYILQEIELALRNPQYTDRGTSIHLNPCISILYPPPEV